MPSSATRKRLAALLLLCLPPLPLAAGEEPPPSPLATPAQATAAPATAAVPGWNRLRFAADGVTGSVSTTLTLSPASMAELDAPPYADLQDTPEAFSSRQLLRLQVEGEIRTLFGSSATRASVWFDAGSDQALLRERTSTGSRGSSKIHRFGARGAGRLRLEPEDSRQAELAITEWTRRQRKFYHYDMQRSGCSTITVPALLLYSISRQPAVSSYCVFHDDALYRVRLEPRGSDMNTVSYTLDSPGGQRHINQPRRLEQLALRIEPLSQKAVVDDFELLELRGELSIRVDPEYHLPVQVSGSRRGAGMITIQLTSASLDADAGR
mgnify:FL=1